jgi:hypothetical protein
MSDDGKPEFVKLELVDLLGERSVSLFERRRRRMRAALARLKEARVSLHDCIRKDRKGFHLNRDEFCVSHFGFLPGERERLEAGKVPGK